MMKIRETELMGVYVIEPTLFEDGRGWFMESYSKEKLRKQGVDILFVQDNHSLSLRKGTLRGLHFQNAPKAQTKLVRCIRGSILDVAIDIRKGSPTYKHWICTVLSGENKNQLFIPKGFAHGFITLEDDTEVEYKVDEYYCASLDRSIRFDDPQIGINWGVKINILSEKDSKAPFLSESDCNFIYRPGGK